MALTKVAVVGVGALGKHHARVYGELPNVELVGVVDSQDERAREVARACGCQSYTNYREVLDAVEAISLAVPTHKHAQIGRAFLKRGIHVLVEKPISRTLLHAEQLIEAREKTGCVLQVGHSERFNPAFQVIKPYLTRPQFFEAHRLGVFVPRSLDIDVVLDLMIHDLDLILHLVGEPVEEIRAVGIPVLTHRIDIANARVEFKSGCIANLTASRVSKEKIRKLRFFQPHDYVSLDLNEQKAEMYSLINSSLHPKIVERRFDIHRGEPLRLEIQAFLAAVGGSDREAGGGCSGEEGRRALDLGLQILNAIQK